MFEDRPKNVRLFGELMRRHNHMLQRELGKFGIYRGQHFVLFCLLKNPGITQIEMAQEFGITKASIGATVSRMEKNGLIDRRPDEKDARRNRLYITDKGKKTADECRYQVNKMQTALFKKFTASEQVMVQDVLERMLEGIKELENEKDE